MTLIRVWAAAALSLLALCVAAPACAAPPPLEAYGKLPAIELMRLSPSGKRFAFITVVGEKRELAVATVDDLKPLIVSGVGSTKVRDIEWAGDDHVLVTVSQTVNLGVDFSVARDELFGVIVFDLKGAKPFSVFAGSQKVANAVFGRYGAAKVDGRWYGYFGGLTFTPTSGGSNVLDHTYVDLYQVDLDTGAFHLVGHGSERSGGWLVGPSGEIVARLRYDEKSGDWSIFAGGQIGGKAILTGNAPYGGPSLMGLARTADAIVINNPDAKAPDYQIVPLAGGASQTVQEPRPISNMIFDRNTGLWEGQTLEGDEPETVLFDAAMQAKVRGARKAFPNYRVTLESRSDDFNRMIVMTDGGDDAGTYWLVDIATHAAKVLGAAYPDVKDVDVGPVRMFDWKAADGLALHGVLTLPAGRAAHGLPVIVLPHGGPQARDYPGFDWWAQALASRGYAVFQPNFRGSDGYGEPLVDAGMGEWGRKMQTDVSDGLAALAAQGIVDPKRACIVGASYGGYAALAGVTVQHGLYRCAVSVAGVADLRGFLRYETDRSGYVSDAMRYWKAFMGVKTGSEASLDNISPVELAAHADAPVLLIHGKDDTVVPIEQSQAMQRALQNAGKPVEMVIMPSEDHWLSREATRQAMLTAAVAFVQKYNPPD